MTPNRVLPTQALGTLQNSYFQTFQPFTWVFVHLKRESMTYSQKVAKLSITSFNAHAHIDFHIMIWNHNVPNNTMTSLSMISLKFSLYQLECFVSLSGHCHAIYGIVCHPFLSSHRKMSNVIWNAGISNSPIFDAGESMLSYAGIPSKIVTQPYLSYFICCLSWRCETLNGRNWKKRGWKTCEEILEAVHLNIL